MERREVFSPMDVTMIRAGVSSALLTIGRTGESDITVDAEGNEGPLSELSVELKNGVLTLREPFFKTIFNKAGAKKTIRIGLPEAWKGGIRLSSVTGGIRVSDLDASDLVLRTLSGGINACGIRSMLMKTVSWTGITIVTDMLTDQAVFRTFIGPLSVRNGTAEQWRVRAFRAQCEILTECGYKTFRGRSLFSDIVLETVSGSLDGVIRSVTGRLRTNGLDLRENAPKTKMTSLTGDLILCRPDTACPEDDRERNKPLWPEEIREPVEASFTELDGSSENMESVTEQTNTENNNQEEENKHGKTEFRIRRRGEHAAADAPGAENAAADGRGSDETGRG